MSTGIHGAIAEEAKLDEGNQKIVYKSPSIFVEMQGKVDLQAGTSRAGQDLPREAALSRKYFILLDQGVIVGCAGFLATPIIIASWTPKS